MNPGRDAHTDADIEFHRQMADVYDSALGPMFQMFDRIVSTYLDQLAREAPGRRALDLGCGTGSMTLALAERGFHVTGVDHSPAMLALARDKVVARGLEHRVQLLRGDVRSVSFGDAQFDVVTCQGMLHHLESLSECAAEMARVLVPDGRLYIAEPCDEPTPVLATLNAIQRARHRSRPAPAEASHEEGPIDPRELVASLEGSGVSVSITYFTHVLGLHRLRSVRAQEMVTKAISTPWRRRGGNVLIARGRRRVAG